ncbi:MAG TPA: GNAT family N-acetyltransferase [Candidatus Eisenbacteria bacterium]|jgi:CelD/BcsL family acetyltransferase involved in cellulose biosynthesis
MLQIERVTTREAFDGLGDAWSGLLAETDGGVPFLTHDWFQCCVHAYRDPVLHVLVARDGSRVVGIAPLWRYRGPVRGIDLRQIGFISCPDTPTVDFVIAPSRTEDVLVAFLDDLRSRRDFAWDLLALGQWPAGSRSARTLRSLLKEARIPHYVTGASLVPSLRIRGSWEEYWKTRAPLFRKSRRGIVNRMTRAGASRVRLVRRDESGDAFQSVLSISRRSWKEPRGLSISSRPATVEFFRRLTEVAGRKGWLFLWLLELDGVPVAMEYDLTHAGIVYALRADIDEAYKERSPGAYLEYQLVKHLFEEGYSEYNTGPGLNPYKLRWTDQIAENLAVHACGGTWRGRVTCAVEGILAPAWRRLRARAAREAPAEPE